MRLERDSDEFDIPNCLGFSVAGDEKQEGPAFNYARIFTWWNMANRVHRALEKTDENMARRLDMDLELVPRDQEFRKQNLTGSAPSMARYSGLAHDNHKLDGPAIEPEQIREYPRWSELDSAFYQRIVIAVVIALYVQWGTTGAAVIIAYLTEVTGLGCRSGGYILYGALGSLVFLLLFLSSIFSHAAMLRHEQLQIITSAGGARGFRGSSTYDRKLALSHKILRVCAVLTRILGRLLAVSNAVWIILSTLWELVGFYDGCWCDSTALSKGVGGWVLLFIKPSEAAKIASAPWAGSVVLSVAVGATSCGIFWMYCRESPA